ncbi:MAG TPA: TfpX/TfpZ family type IV pilin accessory protein [Ramlibacter sp.]|nr:TfpX/TfpZ family type IV pilin accessory protein [Ramlibacter sp.]
MALSFNWRSRGKAALTHVACSAIVAVAAAALVFLLWYPWPYTALAGGAKLFLLITGVDVVMGPVITFAIFDRRKPWAELRRDLAIVVLLQLAALCFGVYTMYVARPVALALENNRFRVVTANAVALEELPQAVAGLQQLSNRGPLIIRTESPTEAGEMLDSIEKALAGADLGTRPKYWRPWDAQARKDTLAAGKPISDLRVRYTARAAEMDAAIERTGKPAQQLRYLPILSRFEPWIALIDASTGDIVGYAPFDAY